MQCQNTPFSDLISQWPTIGELANDVGREYQTVAAWKRRNTIPIASWEAVVAAAKKRGIKGVSVKSLLEMKTISRIAKPSTKGATR